MMPNNNKFFLPPTLNNEHSVDNSTAIKISLQVLMQ